MVCFDSGRLGATAADIWPSRARTRRTLGRTLVDQRRPLSRVRLSTQGTESPIHGETVIPSDVQMEQRHVQRAPGT